MYILFVFDGRYFIVVHITLVVVVVAISKRNTGKQTDIKSS